MEDLSHLMTVPEESADPAVQRLAALSKGSMRMKFARQSLQGELGSGTTIERVKVALKCGGYLTSACACAAQPRRGCPLTRPPLCCDSPSSLLLRWCQSSGLALQRRPWAACV